MGPVLTAFLCVMYVNVNDVAFIWYILNKRSFMLLMPMNSVLCYNFCKNRNKTDNVYNHIKNSKQDFLKTASQNYGKKCPVTV